MRYIDADALLEEEQASEFVVGVRNGKSLLVACKNYLKMVIDNAPTADVVEVVRCRDCKYWLKWHDRWALEKDTIPEGLWEAVEDWGECECPECWNQETEADFYCKYGERRMDEG